MMQPSQSGVLTRLGIASQYPNKSFGAVPLPAPISAAIRFSQRAN